MANYCSCKLNITSNIPNVLEKIETTRNFLEFLNPMPIALSQTVTNGYQGDEPEWRKWRVENWDCPYDIEIDEFIKLDEREICLRFSSQNSPPLAALQYGAKALGYTFKIIYCEPGNGLSGIATELGNTEYFLLFDAPPKEEGIPQELIDEFDLEEMYEEHEE